MPKLKEKFIYAVHGTHIVPVTVDTWDEAKKLSCGISGTYVKKIAASKIDDYIQSFQTEKKNEVVERNDVVFTDGSLKDGLGSCAGFFGDDDPRNFAMRLPVSFLNDTVPVTELFGAIEAAKRIEQNGTIYVDAMYVFNIANNPNSVNWKINNDLIVEFRRLVQQKNVLVEKVKAHANIYGNAQADLMARNVLS